MIEHVAEVCFSTARAIASRHRPARVQKPPVPARGICAAISDSDRLRSLMSSAVAARPMIVGPSQIGAALKRTRIVDPSRRISSVSTCCTGSPSIRIPRTEALTPARCSGETTSVNDAPSSCSSLRPVSSHARRLASVKRPCASSMTIAFVVLSMNSSRSIVRSSIRGSAPAELASEFAPGACSSLSGRGAIMATRIRLPRLSPHKPVIPTGPVRRRLGRYR